MGSLLMNWRAPIFFLNKAQRKVFSSSMYSTVATSQRCIPTFVSKIRHKRVYAPNLVLSPPDDRIPGCISTHDTEKERRS